MAPTVVAAQVAPVVVPPPNAILTATSTAAVPPAVAGQLQIPALPDGTATETQNNNSAMQLINAFMGLFGNGAGGVGSSGFIPGTGTAHTFNDNGRIYDVPAGGPMPNWPESWQKYFLSNIDKCAPALANADVLPASEISGATAICSNIDRTPSNRKLFWMTLLEGISLKESGNDPSAIGPVVPKSGQRATGVLQLSADSMQAYHKANPQCCPITQDTSGGENSTFNPTSSIGCALVMLNQFVSKDRTIASDDHKGASEYWQPMMKVDADKRADILKRTKNACESNYAQVTPSVMSVATGRDMTSGIDAAKKGADGVY